MPQPITLSTGQEFTFTIRRGVGSAECVSVNYDDFVNDVEVGDMLLVDGMLYLIDYVKLASIIFTMLIDKLLSLGRDNTLLFMPHFFNFLDIIYFSRGWYQ